MRKYFYLLFVALVATMSISLTSCGDNDDKNNDEPSYNGSIIGSWRLVEGVADAMDGQQYEQFREDGTYYEVLVYNDEWAQMIGTNVLVDKGTWSLDGNILNVSIKNSIIVKKISSKELILKEMGVEFKLKRVSDELVNEYIYSYEGD